MGDPDLFKQTKVNLKKQVPGASWFQATVTEPVVDDQDAHNAMADYFLTHGVNVAVASGFDEAAIDWTCVR